MARLARDAVAHYYPDEVSVEVNGLPATEGSTVTLPVGARSAELLVQLISRGGVSEPPPTSGGPHTYQWTFFTVTGCADVAFLSPESQSTRFEWLNPGDTAQVELTVTGRFARTIRSFKITVPA
jgi:hypothetical protein